MISGSVSPPPHLTSPHHPAEDAAAAQEEKEKAKERNAKTLSDLEMQYETSRFMTHLGKGLGLGFATRVDPSKKTDPHI